MKTIHEHIQQTLQLIKEKALVSNLVFKQGQVLFLNGQCQLLAQSGEGLEFSVFDEFDDYKVQVKLEDEKAHTTCQCKAQGWCAHKIAGLMQTSEEYTRISTAGKAIGKAYTRPGMIKRVMEERRTRAEKAEYRIDFAANIHGEHILFNEKNQPYRLTFRDAQKEIGYCSCPDYETNKLGTCKHLMYAFDKVQKQELLLTKKSADYPFIEIYLDPLQNYTIAAHYTSDPGYGVSKLLQKYFKGRTHIPEDESTSFLGFIQNAQDYKQILIRPDVYKKVEKAYNKRTLQQLSQTIDVRVTLEKMLRKVKLFPYQIEGVEFATFREGAIIADEMGLGKTLQAISVAILKKHLFDFSRTLVICPASLKEQWKREIEKYTHEKAIIVEGFPEFREQLYQSKEAHFIIVNYETVLRDVSVIKKFPPDLIILDEAQRIKNYETLTANVIQSLQKKHALVITGTPIENRLVDLYSVVHFIDNKFLSPLWEFSYQYCYFDETQKDKITGYYNLQELNERISEILIRREKKDVLKQLPNVSQLDVPIELTPEQEDMHASFARGVASILAKKYRTPFDMQQLMLLLSKMRMVCDSTYLVDLETNHSPKLTELEHILLHKLNLKESNRKIIIFSEWKRMNNIIARMLRKNEIGFVELNGSIPVKTRGQLRTEFEDNPDCRIFLSTEAGGVGLNLQVADTVINFELPWNPAKKNQRIGRIDRIGQLKKNLSVINLIAKNSIEEKIAAGLELKQNLFDGVLNAESDIDTVDFSEKGKAQFLLQLQEYISEYAQQKEDDTLKESKEAATPIEKTTVEKKEADAPNNTTDKEQVTTETSATQMQAVMQQGLGFLSGIFKMATGNDLGFTDDSISINQETGEVVMKFKIPTK